MSCVPCSIYPFNRAFLSVHQGPGHVQRLLNIATGQRCPLQGEEVYDSAVARGATAGNEGCLVTHNWAPDWTKISHAPQSTIPSWLQKWWIDPGDPTRTIKPSDVLSALTWPEAAGEAAAPETLLSVKAQVNLFLLSHINISLWGKNSFPKFLSRDSIIELNRLRVAPILISIVLFAGCSQADYISVRSRERFCC